MDYRSSDSLAADAAAASAALEAYLQGTLSLPDAEAALRRVDGQMSFDAWLDGAPNSPAVEAVLARYAALAALLGWPPPRAR